jgi:hypothetical protein
MSRNRILVLAGLSLVILGFVGTLQVDVDSSFGKVLYGNAFVPALLFFVFFGAIAGILKIFVDAALQKRQSPVESKLWERTRTKGKMSFILDALLISGVPILIALAVPFAASEWSSYSIRNFIVTGVVLLGGVVAIANAIWSYQESLYKKAHASSALKSTDADQ